MQTDEELISFAIETLVTRLGDQWTVRRLDQPARRSGLERPDAVLSIVAPDGCEALQLLEVKRQVYPRDISRWLTALPSTPADRTRLVVAPYLTDRSRELLEAARINHIDAVGNVLVRMSRPAVHLRERAQSVRPPSEDGGVRSLRGGKAARLVRTVCDSVPPFTARTLASLAGVTPGYVSKVLALLERDALLERRPRGAVETVDWDALLRRWAVDYRLLSSNACRLYLAPQGIPAFLRDIGDLARRRKSFRYALTGSFAASRRAPVAPPSLVFCYADDPAGVAQETGLIQASGAGNVYVCEPFDPVVFERTWEDEGYVFAALTQVAVDCLTGPDRMPAEGEALIEWMTTNESRWRVSL